MTNETGPGWELRLGMWQDVLTDVEQVDAVITDPPYSKRTHGGYNSGIAAANATTYRGKDKHDGLSVTKRDKRKPLGYEPWTPDDARAFVEAWAERVRRWFVVVTDHVLAPHFCEAMESAGRYVFAPLPYVEPGSRPRLTGDGPASWTCQIVVSRPRTEEGRRWRSLPGAYILPNRLPTYMHEKPAIGGKPLWLMRELVRDYSAEGDLICDPCAGAATTLLAAVIEHRKAIGAELTDEHFDLAAGRLGRGYTPAMDFDKTPPPATEVSR